MAGNLQPISSDGGFTSGGNISVSASASPAPYINGFASINTTLGGNLGGFNFNANGVAIMPTGETVFRNNGDTITIASYDTPNSISRSMRLGDNGGLYLEQSGLIPAQNRTWLTINPNAGNVEITGSIGIVGSTEGGDLSITGGAAEPSTYNTSPGGNVNITGGLGASDDGGGGGQGGSVNISAGLSADPAGVAGNVKINTGGSNTWTFDYAGNMTLPTGGNIYYANGDIYGAGGSASISNGSSNVSIPYSGGEITVGVGGSSNVLVITSSGANIPGTLTVGNSFTANGPGTFNSNLTANSTLTANGNVRFGGTGPSSGNFISNVESIFNSTLSTSGNVSFGGGMGSPNLVANIDSTFNSNVTFTSNVTGNGSINFSQSSRVRLGNVSNLSITGGSSGQVLGVDGGGNLAFVSPSSTSIRNGNSNVSIPSFSSDVIISVADTSNVVVVGTAGANIKGTLTVTGNITANGTAGVITPNLPAFRVYGSVSTDIPGGTTVTSTQGATVDYNQGSYYNNTTGIFTAPVAGIYSCAATLRVGSTNGMNQASIQKNSDNTGANVIAFWELIGNTSSNGFGHMSMAGMAKLAEGDTIRLQVITGNVQFDTNDSFSVTFLG